MTSASIKSRGKSTNWLRTVPTQTTLTTVRETVDTIEDQNTLSFEQVLPATCNKFGCPFSIVVKKEYLKGEIPKAMRRKDSTRSEDTDRSKVTSNRSKGSAAKKNKVPEIEIPPGAIVVISRYDKSNRLNEIHLKRTDVRPREFMQVLAHLAPFYPLLYKIVLERCRLNAYVLYDLNKMLSVSTITEVYLDESALPEANYAILLDNDESKLKHLSLARCCINDTACQQIASNLHFNKRAAKQLVSLNLSSNRITNIGAKFIADALRSNRILKILNLCNNQIGDIGFLDILDTLVEFPLTDDEIAQQMKCNFDFMRKRLSASLEQLHHTDPDSDSDSIASHQTSISLARKILMSLKDKHKNARENKLLAQTSTKTEPSNKGPKKLKSSEKMSIPEKSKQNKKTQSPENSSSPVKLRSPKKSSPDGSRSPPYTKPSRTAKVVSSKKKLEVSAEVLDSYVQCTGPFNSYTTTKRDGWTYCKGNMVISYLNISYNDISYISLKKLLAVLNIQNEMRQETGEMGLIKINIEGNPLPLECTELNSINNLLSKFTIGGKSSKDLSRKKSVVF